MATNNTAWEHGGLIESVGSGRVTAGVPALGLYTDAMSLLFLSGMDIRIRLYSCVIAVMLDIYHIFGW